MQQCWHHEPEQRPVFDDVMSALEEMVEILEGSMLGAMAREAVHEEYPSQLGGGSDALAGQQRQGGEDSPAVATAIAAAGGASGMNGRSVSAADPTVGGIKDEAAFDEMDFLNQTLTWDDVLELEQKINMQELQLEVVTLRRELEDARMNQSKSMTANHHRSMQSKDEIMEEHAEELRRLETSVLQERMRQKIKLRKRLKQNKRKSRPDVNYALSLINNPKKLAQRLDEVNSALEKPRPSCSPRLRRRAGTGGMMEAWRRLRLSRRRGRRGRLKFEWRNSLSTGHKLCYTLRAARSATQFSLIFQQFSNALVFLSFTTTTFARGTRRPRGASSLLLRGARTRAPPLYRLRNVGVGEPRCPSFCSFSRPLEPPPPRARARARASEGELIPALYNIMAFSLGRKR